jgi:hypothetical protein
MTRVGASRQNGISGSRASVVVKAGVDVLGTGRGTGRRTGRREGEERVRDGTRMGRTEGRR